MDTKQLSELAQTKMAAALQERQRKVEAGEPAPSYGECIHTVLADMTDPLRRHMHGVAHQITDEITAAVKQATAHL
jgi:hypothetical protein